MAALYSEVIKLDKKLTNLCTNRRSLDDPDVEAARSLLCEKSAALLLTDYTYATSKDVDALLWRSAFYRFIEDYRKRIRKFAGAVAANVTGAQATLDKTVSTFSAFCDDGCQFFAQLSSRLQQTLSGVDSAHPNRSPVVNVTCSRCEVYIGDLTRYSALQHPGEALTKDWSTPAGHYSIAARLHPQSGMPHNQLAVLATYIEDDTTALYQYCRAMLCTAPFPTARANLILLLDKRRSGGHIARAANSWQHVEEAYLTAHSAFLARHNTAIDAALAAVRYMEEALVSADGSAQLLAWGATPAEPPRGLLLLSAALGAATTAAWAADDADDAPHVLSAAMAAARVLLYATAAALLRAAAAQASRPVVRGAALACALPFLEWAAASPSDSMATAPGEPLHASEATHRASCWAATAALCNAVQDAGVQVVPATATVAAPPAVASGRRGSLPLNSTAAAASWPALAEDYELRGFLPLEACHAAQLRFGGQAAWTAATGAATTGEPEAVQRSRAERALSCGVRLASAGGGTWVSLLTQSSATGRFALRQGAAPQPGLDKCVWRTPPGAVQAAGSSVAATAAAEAVAVQPAPAAAKPHAPQPRNGACILHAPRSFPTPTDVSILPLPFPGLLAAAVRAAAPPVTVPPPTLPRTMHPFLIS